MARRHAHLAALAAVLLTMPLASALAQAPSMTVHKSPWCGCCEGWIDHMRGAGFDVVVEEREDVLPVKALAGVPDALFACHTAAVAGYVVEGHVPADVVARFLEEQPRAAGIAGTYATITP